MLLAAPPNRGDREPLRCPRLPSTCPASVPRVLDGVLDDVSDEVLDRVLDGVQRAVKSIKHTLSIIVL